MTSVNRQQAAELLEKYNQGTASETERALVERWYESEAGGRQLPPEHFFEHLNAELWDGIVQKTGIAPSRTVRRLHPWYRVAAAAAVLLFVCGGLFFLLNNRKAGPGLADNQPQQATIPPGGNKAILTLGDGSEISLTDAANGEVAKQGGARITKTKDGQLVYEPAGEGGREKTFNTISTPRGGQYSIALPDGTRVWLNAASSIVFPASFTGLAERRVELTGEAYFEVAKDRNKPFLVASGGQTVQVLGTHFNINAYKDEPEIKTTLLEGSVNVNGTVLRPGQQAVLQNGSLRVMPADAGMETAWKNGEFIFNGQHFNTVMRTISRWYDVDVVYEHNPGALRIGGEVSRSRNLEEVLKMLEVTGNVKFRIEGRKITVAK